MGVKSTVTLSREEAEDKYWDLIERLSPQSKRVPYDTETLEDLLELLNDRVNGGEGFENYMIRENDETSK